MSVPHYAPAAIGLGGSFHSGGSGASSSRPKVEQPLPLLGGVHFMGSGNSPPLRSGFDPVMIHTHTPSANDLSGSGRPHELGGSANSHPQQEYNSLNGSLHQHTGDLLYQQQQYESARKQQQQHHHHQHQHPQVVNQPQFHNPPQGFLPVSNGAGMFVPPPPGPYVMQFSSSPWPMPPAPQPPFQPPPASILGHPNGGGGGANQAKVWQEQLAEAVRDKGILCRDFHETGRCALHCCPYAHLKSNQTCPVPDMVCNFHLQGRCLRDNCRYFHGSKDQLRTLHRRRMTSGNDAPQQQQGRPTTTYNPSEFLPIRPPPSELSIDVIERCLQSRGLLPPVSQIATSILQEQNQVRAAAAASGGAQNGADIPLSNRLAGGPQPQQQHYQLYGSPSLEVVPQAMQIPQSWTIPQYTSSSQPLHIQQGGHHQLQQHQQHPQSASFNSQPQYYMPVPNQGGGGMPQYQQQQFYSQQQQQQPPHWAQSPPGGHQFSAFQSPQQQPQQQQNPRRESVSRGGPSTSQLATSFSSHAPLALSDHSGFASGINFGASNSSTHPNQSTTGEQYSQPGGDSSTLARCSSSSPNHQRLPANSAADSTMPRSSSGLRAAPPLPYGVIEKRDAFDDNVVGPSVGSSILAHASTSNPSNPSGSRIPVFNQRLPGVVANSAASQSDTTLHSSAAGATFGDGSGLTVVMQGGMMPYQP